MATVTLPEYIAFRGQLLSVVFIPLTLVSRNQEAQKEIGGKKGIVSGLTAKNCPDLSVDGHTLSTIWASLSEAGN